MYQQKHNYTSGKWKHRLYTMFLLGVMCLALICMEGVLVGGTPAAYADGQPGGNVSDASVRAVDIAKPAVVRIITLIVGQLTVQFSKGSTVTFPRTPQQGFNGYPLQLSGTGTFISAHGDILTADHVINPVQDDKTSLDQGLDQLAAPDIATYINQNLNPAQPATADQVTQELIAGQLQSTSQYQKAQSQAFLSTDFTGPLSATSIQNIPPSQFANVDQIKASSPFTEKDLAIIHVSGMDNKAMVQLGDSSAVQEQDNLTIIGFPGNGDVTNDPSDFLTSSINTVMVSSIKAANTTSPLIQVSGNVEHGDSGGPALDKAGSVVGVVSFGVGTQGSTSFLRSSNSLKSLLQTANIDTTPSAFQKAWNQAFTDYAAQTPGHWHLATQEFQQLQSQYPQFKAVSKFLQYASQQAQTETSTPTNQSGSTPGSGTNTGISGASGINSMYIVLGGIALLLIILLIGGVALARRRKPAVASSGYGTPPLAGNMPGAPGAMYGNSMPQQQPGQSYGNSFVQPPPTVSTPSQVLPQRSPVYGVPQQQSASLPNAGYRPPATPPLPPTPASPTVGGMSAFGAPPVPNTPAPNNGGVDNTIVRGQPATPVPQWRTWPCGHTNRSDARFCGICGESAPRPPLVRRLEQ